MALKSGLTTSLIKKYTTARATAIAKIDVISMFLLIQLNFKSLNDSCPLMHLLTYFFCAIIKQYYKSRILIYNRSLQFL